VLVKTTTNGLNSGSSLPLRTALLYRVTTNGRCPRDRYLFKRPIFILGFRPLDDELTGKVQLIRELHSMTNEIRPADSSKKKYIRLTLVEVIALVVVVSILTVTVYRERMRPHFFFSEGPLEELVPLTKGGPRSSMGVEEWIVRDYFQDRRDGVFLDVGANHYQDRNNTYFLETSLGWSGIAVDALEEFAPDYKLHRPRTRYIAMFASDVTDSKVQFFVPENDLVASASKEFTARYGAAGQAREVPTTTLTSVLDQAGITKIDYLSMDIELAEPKALAGFDINRFKPELVCIEAHPEVRQEILEYFARHQYVLVGKYLRVDPHNLHFQPRR
jgi:FkbM family methyltransferase